jgi:hypothetical protein
VVEAPDHLEVLRAGQVLVDRGVLPREADLRAQRGGVADRVEADDARRAAVGLQEGGEDAHGRRLAGAVGAEEPEHRARLGREVDAAEGVDLSVGLLEARDLDRWIVHCQAS